MQQSSALPSSPPSPPPSGSPLPVRCPSNHLPNSTSSSKLAELDVGIGDYWSASLTTVATGGVVTVRPVISTPGGSVVRYQRQSAATWYTNQPFEFLVYDTARPWGGIDATTASSTFGPVARTYVVGPYRVLVWRHPLFVPGTRLSPVRVYSTNPSSRHGIPSLGCQNRRCGRSWLKTESGSLDRTQKGCAGSCQPPWYSAERGRGSASRPSPIGAEDGIRTHDPHLGKVMRYRCATSAWRRFYRTDRLGLGGGTPPPTLPFAPAPGCHASARPR